MTFELLPNILGVGGSSRADVFAPMASRRDGAPTLGESSNFIKPDQ